MQAANPIEAVVHRDPYAVYAQWRACGALTHDAQLGVWIAARAGTLQEVFASADCRVRPPQEAVPSAIAGSPAGQIFGHLVRMNDGTCHANPRQVLERALGAMPSSTVASQAQRVARARLPALRNARALSTWVIQTPVSVVAKLLGFGDKELPTVAALIDDFVACLSTWRTPAQLHAASQAALHLRTRLQALLREAPLADASLLGAVRAQAGALQWWDADALVANLVGLLSQSYESTAGLIGNSIVALATREGLLDTVRSRPDGWAQLVHEVSRIDPPVQNTRRFVAASTRIAGVKLEPGAVILLLLAAANRDPEANQRPDDFLLDRADRRVFTFGRGAHACPGQLLARAIAQASLQALFDESPSTGDLADLVWSYRPSPNGRIPVFSTPTPQKENP